MPAIAFLNCIEVKFNIGGQIHLVEDHCIHRSEDTGIFVGFVVSFRHAGNDHANLFAQLEIQQGRSGSQHFQ